MLRPTLKNFGPLPADRQLLSVLTASLSIAAASCGVSSVIVDKVGS